MKRLILYLIRKRLGLEKYEHFRFTNQKSNAIYYFTSEHLIKYYHGNCYFSGVSLNWILSEQCEIEKVHDKKGETND